MQNKHVLTVLFLLLCVGLSAPALALEPVPDTEQTTANETVYERVNFYYHRINEIIDFPDGSRWMLKGAGRLSYSVGGGEKRVRVFDSTEGIPNPATGTRTDYYMLIESDPTIFFIEPFVTTGNETVYERVNFYYHRINEIIDFPDGSRWMLKGAGRLSYSVGGGEKRIRVFDSTESIPNPATGTRTDYYMLIESDPTIFFIEPLTPLQNGSISVTIEPAEARSAGAQWRRTGTSVWHDSGYTESRIPAGTHTLEFKDVSGWNTPHNITVTITTGQNTQATGTYTASAVRYRVTVSASPTQGGAVSGGGTYTAGQSITVRATAHTGWGFVNWTENTRIVSTSPNYAFTITGDRVLVANFNEIPPGTANQPFPDTGQTKCYNNTVEIPCPQTGEPFYGQDAQYQPRLPRSYTKLGYGGVELTDSAAHVDDGGPWMMTRDNVTGLIWEIKTETNKDDEYNWQDAQDVFVTGLNASGFGGFNDWRLPEIGELASLVNRGVFEPALDVVWFPNTAPNWYWSSSTYAGNSSNAWVVSFSNGYDYDDDKTDSRYRYVRAVRSGQSGLLDDFIINGDGTITDPNTELMWQEQTAPGTYTWQEALAYSEGLNLGGYSDWRLPNINELRTLVDYTRWGPAIGSVLAETVAWRYWSSSTYANFTHIAWVVNFGSGHDNVYDKTDIMYVRAVRGGQPHIGSIGNLTILIEPAEARTAGAQWRRMGTAAWYDSGDNENNIPVGSHTVEFKDIGGWNKPGNITVIITDGQITQATGTYTAVAVQHTVNAAAGTGGSVLPTFRTVDHGATARFTVTPVEGYTYGSIGGTCPPGSFNGNIYTTGTISVDCLVRFHFVRLQHTVTASIGAGGNVTPGSRSVTHGETASFTVTANPGYTRDNSVGGTCPAGSWNGNIYTTGSINNSCTVRFSFTQFHSAAVRAISGCSVCIAATPPNGTHTWAVEETIPNGLTVSGIIDGGVFSAANRKINWGLFFGSASHTLCYEVSGVNGQYDVSGVISLDGVSNTISGSSRITLPCGNMTHPADGNSDWVLGINEATAYGAAWRRGDVWPIPPDPININYVTRAGYLWKNGGDYHRSDGFPPDCWISGIGPSSITALYPDLATAKYDRRKTLV